MPGGWVSALLVLQAAMATSLSMPINPQRTPPAAHDVRMNADALPLPPAVEAAPRDTEWVQGRFMVMPRKPGASDESLHPVTIAAIPLAATFALLANHFAAAAGGPLLGL